MIDTPEIIYLIHGEYEGERCRVWCDDPAPSEYCDPAEAVKYVRADTLPTPCLPPRPPEGEGLPRFGLQWNGPTSPLSVPMNDGYWTPWHLANDEIDQLQAKVAEATLGRDSAKDAEVVAWAEVDALRARVAEALRWIEGDLRDVIRDVGSRPVEYNDLYECADKIEAVLLGKDGGEG